MIRNLIVFYVDIGQLPPDKAEAFAGNLERIFNEKYGLSEKLEKQGTLVMWMPVRPGSSSHVEVIPIDDRRTVMDVSTMKASSILPDEEILTKVMNYSKEEAKELLAKMKVQKMEDIKLQVLAQNPQLA